MSDAQAHRGLSHVDRLAQGSYDGEGLALNSSPPNEIQRTGGKSLGQGHVFSNRKTAEKIGVLGDGSDPFPTRRDGVGQPGGLAVEEDLALVGLQNSCDEIDERALTRAVLADQSMDLSRMEVKIHAIQSNHAGKSPCHIDELEESVHASRNPALANVATLIARVDLSQPGTKQNKTHERRQAAALQNYISHLYSFSSFCLASASAFR
jgi:hypothetical protein